MQIFGELFGGCKVLGLFPDRRVNANIAYITKLDGLYTGH